MKHFEYLEIETMSVDVAKTKRFEREEIPKVGDFRLRLERPINLNGQITFGCSIKNLGEPPSKYVRECLYILGALDPAYITDCESLKAFLETDPWSSGVYYHLLVDLSFDNLGRMSSIDDQWEWILSRQNNATIHSQLKSLILFEAIEVLESANVLGSYDDIDLGFIVHDSWWDPNSCLPPTNSLAKIQHLIWPEPSTCPSKPLTLWVSLSGLIIKTKNKRKPDD